MTVLYLLTKEVGVTAEKIINSQKKKADVTVIDLRENKRFGEIIDLIAASDKVIAW